MIIIAVLVLAALALLFLWLHLTNPYAAANVFKPPYRTFIQNGQIEYEQLYRLRVYAGPLANTYGYYVKSCFLILQNTFFGGKAVPGKTVAQITHNIHAMRFDPRYPYMISGDQFSVLYPRNLGVFYNQLLNPALAPTRAEWEDRQRIYLQSVLFAIDGLSASNKPRTTIIPTGCKSAVLTQVHPGGIGSDQVYGLLYALCALQDGLPGTPADAFPLQTTAAAKRVIRERKAQLQHIFDTYLTHIYDPDIAAVHHGKHLSGARDGIVRSGSLYDNIILYETVLLARRVGLSSSEHVDLPALKRTIKQTYWNDARGFYNDDRLRHVFSADWLIGFVTGFFDLSDKTDLERTERTVAYLEQSDATKPFPIKYQIEGSVDSPFFVRWFVPNYGKDAIWSYWGAEYITLLAELYRVTGKRTYLEAAQRYCSAYDATILRDHGFAETFSPNGDFLRATIYKSIRITGWIVQFDYAKYLVRKVS